MKSIFILLLGLASCRDYQFLLSEVESPESLEEYSKKIKSQMDRMSRELDKSDKYAKKELNPILKKIIKDNQVEVLEVKDEDSNGNSNPSEKMSQEVSKKEEGEEMLQLKKHHKKKHHKKHHGKSKKHSKKHHHRK